MHCSDDPVGPAEMETKILLTVRVQHLLRFICHVMCSFMLSLCFSFTHISVGKRLAVELTKMGGDANISS